MYILINFGVRTGLVQCNFYAGIVFLAGTNRNILVSIVTRCVLIR